MIDKINKEEVKNSSIQREMSDIFMKHLIENLPKNSKLIFGDIIVEDDKKEYTK